MSNAQLDSLLKQMRELPIIKRALKKLAHDLPQNLTYHALSHTEDVLHESLLFGLKDKLPTRDLELLAVAAAYHDFGFIIKPISNEQFGADFAVSAMEDSGNYTKSEIALVSQMIMDTTIIQGADGPEFVCRTRLTGYLLDADLSNLGREDFFEKSDLYVQETNQAPSELKHSLRILLQNHKWHTPAAFQMRQEQKLINIARLEVMRTVI